MKSSLLILVTTITFLTACNNKPKSNIEVIEQEVVETIPNSSEIDFDDAMIAYKAGKFKEAAKYFEFAIKDLETESMDLPKAAKDQVNKSLSTLKAIEAKIKQGKTANIDEMEKAFILAEAALAHDYFFLTSVYAIGQPAKAKKSLDKAVNKMEHSVKKLSGEPKESALELLKKGKELQSRNTELTEDWTEEVQNLVKEINKWREENGSELFNTIGRNYYPYNYY